MEIFDRLTEINPSRCFPKSSESLYIESGSIYNMKNINSDIEINNYEAQNTVKRSNLLFPFNSEGNRKDELNTSEMST